MHRIYIACGKKKNYTVANRFDLLLIFVVIEGSGSRRRRTEKRPSLKWCLVAFFVSLSLLPITCEIQSHGFDLFDCLSKRHTCKTMRISWRVVVHGAPSPRWEPAAKKFGVIMRTLARFPTTRKNFRVRDITPLTAQSN